jgi:hypothetical protein
MRTLKLSLAGTVILALLGGLGGAVVAQGEAEELSGVTVEVTAEFRDADCSGGFGGVLTCTVYNEWSDPRLEGIETYVHNAVTYADDGQPADDDELFTIGHFVHDIVTADGAWRMRPLYRLDIPGEREDFPGTWVLDGEGAYQGIVAVLNKEGEDLHGFIVSSDLLPPPPEGTSK